MTSTPSIPQLPLPPRPAAPYLALSLYAVAMAFLEAAVVVYLRELYHPAGFRFPVLPIEPGMALTELGREAATVAMIGAVARLAGGGLRMQFAAFAFVFGVWDVFYYVFLKVLIGWPQGLFDPDVLFLIPAPWVGPVLAPMLVSAVLIALALVLRPVVAHAASPTPIGRLDGCLFLSGAALILWTFLEPNLATAGMDQPVVYPEPYAWKTFLVGTSLGAVATVRLALSGRGIRAGGAT